MASDGAAFDQFGVSVSISGDTVIVGAYDSAYIFSRDQGGADNWGEVKKLTASDSVGGRFGFSVSIFENTAIVGSYYDNDKGSYSGSAYIFSRNQGGANNWGEVRKLIASDGAAGDSFGVSVSISGDTAIVGAFTDDDNGNDSGSAYIFSRDQGGVNNWGEVRKLIATDGELQGNFGRSVSISGDTAIVGAGFNPKGYLYGSAYIFSRDQGGKNNWSEVKKLEPTYDYTIGIAFGLSVSISGDKAIVGYGRHSVFNHGLAFIFSRDHGGINEWGQLKMLSPRLGNSTDYFGISVSISGDTAIAGAIGDDDVDGRFSGAAYVYRSPVVTVETVVGGSTDKDGETVVIAGDDFIVMAIPDPGWSFTHWSPFSAEIDNPLTITNLNSDLKIAPVFVRDTGSLRVTLIGPADGGWKLKGQVAWRPSGDIQGGIPAGSGIVVFKPVDGYKTPAMQEVKIDKDMLTDVFGSYVMLGSGEGSLIFNDPGGEPEGAGWRPVNGGSTPAKADPDGGAWLPFGREIQGLEAGELTVEFRPLPGWITPALMTIKVKANGAVSVSAHYRRPFIADGADYNGDGSIDLAVYDPKTRKWSVASVGSGSMPSAQTRTIVEKKFGARGSVPAPGDYDGDGITDLAYYNPRSGAWRVLKQFTLKNFGQDGDIPVPGDYLGHGWTQAALYRPGEGLWLIHDGEKVFEVKFGGKFDIPVPGDYNGDGRVDLGLYDVTSGEWRVAIKRANKDRWKKEPTLGGILGVAGDIPVQGDYDGDGAADIAVYRPDNGKWIVMDQFEQVFGEPGDLPVAADWNGTGTTIPAVFRARNGTWLVLSRSFKARHGKNELPLLPGAW